MVNGREGWQVRWRAAANDLIVAPPSRPLNRPEIDGSSFMHIDVAVS